MPFRFKYPALIASLFCVTSTNIFAESILEEIVVTSTKRSQTLQEVPIAVSVTSAETIEKAQIRDLGDLQSVVPSLKINTLQNSTNTNFIIRGFGNGANNPGIEPSVGVFIDGVYRSRSASSIADLPNLERIEVLRGPQSTLFGKNASAGVISIVTNTPDGESGGQVSASIGNYGGLVLKGVVEGSLSENTAYEISASNNTRDGYFKNVLTGNDLNDRDRQSVRGQLVFNPNDTTQIRVIADYDQIDELCCGVNNLQESQIETFTNAATNAQLFANQPTVLQGFFNIDPNNQVENSGVSIQFDKEFDAFTFTSISSYRSVDSASFVDLDFTSADIAFNDLNTNIDTITQEFRFTSNGLGNLDWMVGGFYFDESIDYIDDLQYGEDFRLLLDSLSAASGAPNALAGIESALGLPVFQTFYSPNAGVTQESSLDNQALSLFGQFDWHLSENVTATVGLNYTKDEKEAVSEQTQNDAFGSVPLDLLGLSALSALQLFPTYQDFPNAIEDGKSDDDELTYTLRLAYNVNDSVSLYGGISTGFKASSWNLSRDGRPTSEDLIAIQAAGFAVPNLSAGTRFASPEEATVVEVGLKARFTRGAFNMAIFDQKIEGFQSNIFNGTGFNLANAEEQSVTGVEFDLSYYPVDSLQLTLAGTFLDPVFDSFTGASGIDGPTDLSGQTPSGIHETSLSVGASYGFSIAGLDSYIRGDYQYDDDIATNDNVPSDVSRESFKLLNLSAGIETETGLGFSIWGRNLTDHETTTTGFPTPAGTGGYFGYRNAPRTFGVTVKKDW